MNNTRQHSAIDKFLIEADRVLRTLSTDTPPHTEASPAKKLDEAELTESQRKHAAGLMRVNHTGEVCAQALYQGQALTAKLPDVHHDAPAI